MILRNVVVGQTVDATVVLFAMSDKLMVKADVDEVDIGRIRIGMPAALRSTPTRMRPLMGRSFKSSTKA